ncbi:helix-turn-helix domain-containing protein [Neomesorhizobium albiziae]|nr:helix-turn-helix transcriptional regulator [Mesorhizobium albiziae]
MNIVEIFVANLRAVRRARGVSQVDLANSAGLSMRYVGLLERGEKSPTLTTVAAIADALSVEPAELISGPIPLDRVVKLASG